MCFGQVEGRTSRISNWSVNRAIPWWIKMKTLLTTCLLGWVLMATGCEASRENPREANQLSSVAVDPRLQRLEILTLEESAEAAIGFPRTLWVTDDTIFVADKFFNRILLFDRDGRFQGHLGGEGSAPWEFQKLGPIIVSERWILAQDTWTNRVSVFDRTTGRVVGQYRLPAWFSNGWEIASDTVLLGLQDRRAGTTMALFSAEDGSLRQFGNQPVFHKEHRTFAGVFSTVSVAPTPSGNVLWGVSGSNDLFIDRMPPDSTSEPVDTIRLPVRLRHGIPEEFEKRVSNAETTDDWFRSISSLFRLFQVPNGWAAIHYDQRAEGRARISSVFVTVFDYDLRHSCTDMLV